MTGIPYARRAVFILLLLGGAAMIAVFFLRPSADEMPVIGEITAFSLKNEAGNAVTLADLSGKAWVADIIFTRCPGPCARMTRHLADLQANILGDDSARFVTLTSDPEYDTPEVLSRYAAHFDADTNRWIFLTGEKRLIRRLAVNDFKFVAVEKPAADREAPDDLFIHSTWYVTVDKNGKIRGWKDSAGSLHAYYDSEDAGTRARMVRNMRQLLKEKT